MYTETVGRKKREENVSELGLRVYKSVWRRSPEDKNEHAGEKKMENIENISISWSRPGDPADLHKKEPLLISRVS